MRLTPNNTSLWIVNFKRPKELIHTIRSWMTSFNFEEVNIIANHSSTTIDIIPDEFKEKVCIWSNIFREDWETGSIAWCWNQAMKNTFSTKEWCVMSQDDVIVKSGWDKLINDTEYITYIAPVGDVIQIQSIKGFSKIGWFDERFRAIGGPEADYQLRIIQEYPELASIYDDHIWKQRLNTIGLEEFFLQAPRTLEVLETRQNFNVPFAQEECFSRWIQKWGIHVDDVFLTKRYDINRNPGWEEIDWYPSITREWNRSGRL